MAVCRRRLAGRKGAGSLLLTVGITLAASGRSEAREICRDGGSSAPVKMSWQSSFTGIQGASSLALRLEAREAVTGSLELVSQGLDFRTAAKPYGSLNLAAGGETTVVVRMSELPLQGVSYSSLVTVKANLIRADGTRLSLHSPEFYAHYSGDYAQAWVYAGDTMEAELNGGQLTDDAFDLRGRVWDGARFVDIGEVRWMEYGGDPPPQAGPRLGSGEPPRFGPPAPGGATSFTVRVDWETRYVDASHGEDVANTAGSQTLDASYASAEIGRVISQPCSGPDPTSPCVQVVWQGNLDQYGATSLQNPTPGTYFIWFYSKVQKGTTVADVNYYTNSGYNQGIRRWRMSFNVPPPASPLPNFANLTAAFHRSANAAAVVSRLFYLPDLVVANKTYTVHANKGCPSPDPNIPSDDGCAYSASFYTGPWVRISDGQPGGLQHKYIVAHEAGHVTMAFGMGTPYHAYNASIPQASCRCDHVQASNQLHCLQSGELMSTAQVEGFAHFVAARLFNTSAGSDCWFNYYKEFKVLSWVLNPPVNVSCRTPAVRWRDNNCYYNTVGTEYDWMQFYWNVNRIGSNTTSMTNLYNIYQQACGGPCTGGNNVTWATLLNAVFSYYGGAFDLRSIKFADDGDTFGVDDSQHP